MCSTGLAAGQAAARSRPWVSSGGGCSAPTAGVWPGTAGSHCTDQQQLGPAASAPSAPVESLLVGTLNRC